MPKDQASEKRLMRINVKAYVTSFLVIVSSIGSLLLFQNCSRFSAPRSFDIQASAILAVCGSANGVPSPNPPSTNLCSVGTPSSVTGNGPFDWTCSGINGGPSSACRAYVECVPGATQACSYESSSGSQTCSPQSLWQTCVPLGYNGPGAVTVGTSFSIYDTSLTTNCQVFLDEMIAPISFSNPDGSFKIVFSNVDFRGHNYRLTAQVSGGVIGAVTTDCQPILTSALNPNYQLETGAEWLGSLFKVSDTEIYSVIHNEFYGGNFPQSGILFPSSPSCPSGNPLTCTYASVTGAKSSDGGATFMRQGTAPAHSIATPSFPYSPSQTSVTGYFANSNIVQGPDHYYYMMLVDYNASSTLSVCPARTPNLTLPSQWRTWDGTSYSVNSPAGAECTGIQLGISPFYLGYSTYFNGFIAVGTSNTTPFHVSYATSQDFIHWSSIVDLGIAPQWSPGAGSATDYGNYNYPTLLDLSMLKNTMDPNSSSGAVVGQSPLLIIVDRKGDNSATRILGIPLQFSK